VIGIGNATFCQYLADVIFFQVEFRDGWKKNFGIFVIQTAVKDLNCEYSVTNNHRIARHSGLGCLDQIYGPEDASKIQEY
jgi:hypothetical protein